MSVSATTGPAAGAGATDAPASGIYRYGAAVNSHDVVKVLAIAAMVIDHAGWLFVDNNVWMRIVGRLAAPLFFFLVGYSGSYRFKPEILMLGVALSTIGFLTSAENGIDAVLPLEHTAQLRADQADSGPVRPGSPNVRPPGYGAGDPDGHQRPRLCRHR